MKKYHIVRVAPHCAPEVIKVDCADDYPVGLLPESPTFLKPFHDMPIVMMVGRYSNLDGKDTSYGANRFLYSKKKPHTVKNVLMGDIVLFEIDKNGVWCDMSKNNREHCMEVFRKPDKICELYSLDDKHELQKIRFVRTDDEPCEKGRTADTCIGVGCDVKRSSCCILCKGGYRL
ncbi:MAG: hypothetical protein E7425_01970 [Ruminococcaceae bacterium]|nr:hypothetical protein [Oscillospiraceae bacterium]